MNLENHRRFVYQIVRQIPVGKVTTYGFIAQAIGLPNHARWVGKVLQQYDQESDYLPAHRVVNAQGKLTGYAAFGQMFPMEERLIQEGILITNGKIRSLKNFIWDPSSESQVEGIYL
jgi:methylated-DNA-protein-cysteine methyltransferase-like protein